MTLQRNRAYCYESHGVEDTMELGAMIAQCAHEGDVIVLTGGLGAGKTHLTKGIARGLGDDRPVTSPTFSLMAVHERGRIPLFHFDLYRLEHEDELESTGIFDVLGYEGLCVLEWGERFSEALGNEYLALCLERSEAPETRVCFLRAQGAAASALADRIDHAIQQALSECSGQESHE